MKRTATALVGVLLVLPTSLSGQSQRIDVGGHTLEAVVTGAGSLTVVFESDVGTSFEIWKPVQALVSDFATTVAYSRAGLGASDVASTPRSTASVTEELRTLLSRLGLKPPYVLVGHSFGGLLSRAYFYSHPEEVAGLILLEDMHERLFEEILAVDSSWTPNPAPWVDEARLEEVAMLRRIEKAGSLPGSRPLAGIPVHILTRGRPSRGSATEAMVLPVARKLQAELFSSVTNGAHIVVDTNSHFIQTARPDLVAQSIQQVVNAAKSPGSR